MPFSAVPLSARDLALFNADKPILGAAFTLADIPMGSLWTNVNGGAVDLSLAGFPASNAFDGFNHGSADHSTRPNTTITVAAPMYLVFEPTGNMNDFDSVVVVFDDGPLPSELITVDAQIDDFIAWPSPTTLATDTLAAGSRIRTTMMDLDGGGGGPHTIEDAPFFRLKFSISSGTSDISIMGVYLIKRRAMPFFADDPWDNTRQNFEAESTPSDSPISARLVHSQGRQVTTPSFLLNDAASRSEVLSFWSESKFGARPFWFIENPNTGPLSYYMRAISGLTMPKDGSVERRQFSLESTELPLFRVEET